MDIPLLSLDQDLDSPSSGDIVLEPLLFGSSSILVDSIAS